MQDYTSIACTNVSDVIIHKNYQFDLFTLEFPIFSLKLDKKTSEYKFVNKNGTTITVYNRATIKDADILLYCTTKICQLIYENKEVTRKITFTIYDFLKVTSKKTNNGGNYDQVIKSLQRLLSTKIETNKKIANLNIGAGLGLIESFYYKKNEKNKKLSKVEIVLQEWLFAEIMLKKIVTIDSDYLKLKSFERRIYQLAKIHCYKKFNNVFNLDYFAKKMGSNCEIKRFRFEINKLCKSQPLPDFLIHHENDKVWFTLRTRQEKVDESNKKNTLKEITKKFIISQSTNKVNNVEVKKQVAYTLRELDRLYPLKKEAIFRSDVLTKSKIYSYIKEFGPQALLKAIKQHADFDFSAVDNPGGYFWKILKNSRK